MIDFRACFAVLALSLNLLLPAHQASIDLAIAGAIARYNADSGSTFAYVEVGRTVDEDLGGVVYMRLVDRASGEEIPGIVEWLVLLPDGAGWRTLFPGDPGYTASFRQLPDAVNDRSTDAPWRESGDPDIAEQLTLDDYVLPWEDAGWATVTRSYGVHGHGKIDFDLTRSWVTAAKDGVIVYASDRTDITTYDTGAWWYWNTVIIEHGPNEYSLYGHLAPGSIPAAIKAACTDDYSVANCAVPVAAGDVIGAEGNTGYSINPHLHLEVGQYFGVASYPDVHDWDRDGDRHAPSYGGYVYAEHDIAFRGYTPMEVGAWEWGRVEQAYHGAEPPLYAELVRNGGFSEQTTGWAATGQLNWAVVDGVLRVARLRTNDPPDWAGFFQNLGVGAAAGTPFEVTLQLGNSSGIPKYVQLALQSAAGRDYGAIICEFVIPAHTPLERHRVRGVTNATWAGLRLQLNVNPPDSAPGALVDDVSVRRVESAPLQPECLPEPGEAAT